MDDGIFTIKARRCKRCGRLLTSAEAVKLGYGCQCMMKARMEGAVPGEGRKAKTEPEPASGQKSIFDYF